jgi:hypothetical protein
VATCLTPATTKSSTTVTYRNSLTIKTLIIKKTGKLHTKLSVAKENSNEQLTSNTQYFESFT